MVVCALRVTWQQSRVRVRAKQQLETARRWLDEVSHGAEAGAALTMDGLWQSCLRSQGEVRWRFASEVEYLAALNSSWPEPWWKRELERRFKVTEAIGAQGTSELGAT